MLTSDAAEQLEMNKRSVARLCKRGIIRAEKRGRDYWIEPAEVERYGRERRPAHRPRKDESDDKGMG
jgi:hypothetical protein